MDLHEINKTLKALKAKIEGLESSLRRQSATLDSVYVSARDHERRHKAKRVAREEAAAAAAALPRDADSVLFAAIDARYNEWKVEALQKLIANEPCAPFTLQKSAE